MICTLSQNVLIYRLEDCKQLLLCFCTAKLSSTSIQVRLPYNSMQNWLSETDQGQQTRLTTHHALLWPESPVAQAELSWYSAHPWAPVSEVSYTDTTEDSALYTNSTLSLNSQIIGTLSLWIRSHGKFDLICTAFNVSW